MSNARSPREVCSTTIGTSGLTVLASFRFGRSNPSDSPGSAAKTARPAKTSNGPTRAKPGRPVSCEWLLGRRDRRGRLRHQVQRLALRKVVLESIEPAVGAQPLKQLLRLGPIAGRRRLHDGRKHLVLARVEGLGLGDRGEHRLALERLLGV